MPRQQELSDDNRQFGRAGLRAALIKADQFRFVDPEYIERFHQATTATEKSQVLIEYVEKYPDCASKSDWYKAVIGIGPWTSTDRHRRTHHDLAKAIIARLKAKYPSISQFELCAKLDATEVVVPKSWQARKNTWCLSLRDATLNPRVKAYLSKVKAFKPR